YGTTWYHSHFSFQYSNGLYGPLIVNGPATADYDEDLGAVMITDWDHVTADVIWATIANFNVTFNGSDTGLINGMNTGNCTLYNATDPDPNCVGEGENFQLVFEAGKKYRLRVLNVAEEDWVQFSIDNHTLTVIATDFVPIVPYQTDSVLIDMGQRYDVIVEANAPPDNYWLRSAFEPYCIPNGDGINTVRGIVRYNNDSTAIPNSTSAAVLGLDFCVDEQPSNLEPWVPIDLDMSKVKAGIQTEQVIPEWIDNDTYLRWSINGGSYMWVNWSNPALADVISGDLGAIPISDNVFQVGSNSSTTTQSNETEWVVLVIEDKTPFTGISHPMHLHGHDFLVLATGYEQWKGTTYGWHLKNPPRRDTATMPANGFLAIAWPLDNPGVWALHCHITWHSSQGFGASVVESPALIPGTVGGNWGSDIDPVCKAWNAWASTAPFQQTDAGL
ncbi:MAG: laccase, multicopper oxidase, benzenediol:oxygen oxidorectuctase, partial [Bogoriella megaspora]